MASNAKMSEYIRSVWCCAHSSDTPGCLCHFQYVGGGAPELPFSLDSGLSLELGGIWAGLQLEVHGCFLGEEEMILK